MERLQDSDKIIRTNISKFFDSYKTSAWDNYGNKETEVLGWPEIYFQLGKLKSEKGILTELSNFREKVENLTENVEFLNDIIGEALNEDDEIDD